ELHGRTIGSRAGDNEVRTCSNLRRMSAVGGDEKSQLLIGGSWVDGGAGTYPIVNPATEEPVGHAPEATAAQAQAAAEAARDAFASWSRTSLDERAHLLDAAGKAPLARRGECVPLVIAETGCTATLGKAMQVPQAAVRFQRYARGVHQPTVLPLPPRDMHSTPLAPGGLINAIARRQPVGVVACITSYNFPIVNMVGKIAPALAMGDTVIIRPAGQDTLAIVKLVKLLEDVGF